MNKFRARRYRVAPHGPWSNGMYQIEVWRFWWPFWVPICNTIPDLGTAQHYLSLLQLENTDD